MDFFGVMIAVIIMVSMCRPKDLGKIIADVVKAYQERMRQ